MPSTSPGASAVAVPGFSAEPGYDAALARIATALSHRRYWHEAGLQAADVAVPNLLAWGPSGVGKTHGLRRLERISGVPCLSLDLAAAVVRDDGFNLQVLFGQALAIRPDFFAEVRRVGAGLVGLEGIDWLANKPVQAALLRVLDGEVCLDFPGMPVMTQAEFRSLCFVGLGAFDGNPEQGVGPLGSMLDRSGRSLGFNPAHPTGFPGVRGDVAVMEGLVRYGLRRDLVSRFELRVGVRSPDAGGLARIVLEHGGPLHRMIEGFDRLGYRIEVDADAVAALVADAERRGGAVRGLESAVSHLAVRLRTEAVAGPCDVCGWRIHASTIAVSSRPEGIPGRPRERSCPSQRLVAAEVDAAIDPVLLDLFEAGALLPDRPARHPESSSSVRLAAEADLRPYFRRKGRRRP